MKKKYLKTLLKPKKYVWFYPHTLIPLRCFTAKIYCRVSESCWHDHKLNSDGVLRAHIFSSPSLHVLLGRTYMFQTLPLYGSDTFHPCWEGRTCRNYCSIQTQKSEHGLKMAQTLHFYFFLCFSLLYLLVFFCGG